MTERIWKFPIPFGDDVKIDMPKGARIIAVQDQECDIMIWAICDELAEREPVRFVIVGTGHPMPAFQVRHVGTVQQGRFVWHVFLVLP